MNNLISVKPSIVFFVLILTITACGSATNVPRQANTPTQITKTATDIPTLTLSPESTQTPSPTATSEPFYHLGPLDLLPSAPVIITDNIEKTEPLIKFPSESSGFHIEFSDDGKWMIHYNLSGMTIYDTQTFEVKKEFSNNFSEFDENYSRYTKPENIYRFIPHTNWVIINAEMIWDVEKNIEIWSSPSATKNAHLFITNVSADGKFVTTDNEIWNISTLQARSLVVNSNPINIILASDGSQYAVTNYDDDFIHLFNASDGKEIAAIQNPGEKHDQKLFFSPDGKFLLAQSYINYQGGLSDMWTLYNAENGTWVGEIRPPLSYHIETSAGHYFLKGDSLDPPLWDSSQSCDLYIYRLWPAQKINKLSIPSKPAVCQTYQDLYSPYAPQKFFGNLLVTVTHNDHEYHLNAWNVETGAILLHQTSPEPAFVLSAQKDGQLFAFYKPDSGAIELYDAAGSMVKHLDGLYNLSAKKVVHSSDGKLRALLGRDTITLVDTSTEKVLRVIRPDSEEGIDDALFSPDSSMLVIGNVGNSPHIWLYSVADGSLLKMIQESGQHLLLVPHTTQFMTFGTTGSESGISFYNITSLKSVRGFAAPGNQLLSTAISPDGTLLAVGGERNKSAFVYDTAKGTVKWELPVLKYAPAWMQFSPDGLTLYVADIHDFYNEPSRNMLQAWDMQTGKMTSELEITPAWLANFISPDKFKGTKGKVEFLIESISISHDGKMMVFGISAREDGYPANVPEGTKLPVSISLLAYWRIGNKEPFAIKQNIPQGWPQFSDDGRFLIFSTEWWGVP